MAADLQRQRVELERTNRLAAWADMARQVAHDIKNPLTPIQLNAEHLRRVHAGSRRAARPRARRVRRQHPRRRCGCCGRSPASSRASRRRRRPRPAPTPLHELDHAKWSSRIGPGWRAGSPSSWTCRRSLPPLMVDKTLLARALTNIIENALHAMPGGGTLRLRARALGRRARRAVDQRHRRRHGSRGARSHLRAVLLDARQPAPAWG